MSRPVNLWCEANLRPAIAPELWKESLMTKTDTEEPPEPKPSWVVKFLSKEVTLPVSLLMMILYVGWNLGYIVGRHTSH